MSDERDLLEELDANAEVVTAIGDSLPPVAPPSALRDRLFASAQLAGRFDEYITQVAEMLDVPESQAKRYLDSIDTPGVFEPELPGTEFYWVEGGPRTKGAIRGFVRVRQELPPHEHLGDERLLVLQGTYIDGPTGQRLGPGQEHASEAGTTHDFSVVQGGADLLMLVVVFGGYKIGDIEVGPRS